MIGPVQVIARVGVSREGQSGILRPALIARMHEVVVQREVAEKGERFRTAGNGVQAGKQESEEAGN
jgi:hypothetical protein